MGVTTVRRGSSNSDLCATQDRLAWVMSHRGCAVTGLCAGGTQVRCPQSAMVSMGFATAAAEAPGGGDTADDRTGTSESEVDWTQFLAQAGEQGSALWNSLTDPFKPGTEDAVDQAVNEGINAGANDVNVNTNGNAASTVEPTWISQNWPWLLVGGIGVTAVALVAGTVLTSGGRVAPAPRTAPALPPHASEV